MGTENIESCSQRDSAERKGDVRAHRSFNRQCSNSLCQSMSRCFRMTALAIVREEGQKTPFTG